MSSIVCISKICMCILFGVITIYIVFTQGEKLRTDDDRTGSEDNIHGTRD